MRHLWLQPGTRLHMVVEQRSSDEFASYAGASTWEVWTSTDSRTGDSKNWHGTFLRLYPDGTIDQVTRDPHGLETSVRVM